MASRLARFLVEEGCSHGVPVSGLRYVFLTGHTSLCVSLLGSDFHAKSIDAQ